MLPLVPESKTATFEEEKGKFISMELEHKANSTAENPSTYKKYIKYTIQTQLLETKHNCETLVGTGFESR